MNYIDCLYGPVRFFNLIQFRQYLVYGTFVGVRLFGDQK